jgi:hypothetical protein
MFKILMHHILDLLGKLIKQENLRSKAGHKPCQLTNKYISSKPLFLYNLNHLFCSSHRKLLENEKKAGQINISFLHIPFYPEKYLD